MSKHTPGPWYADHDNAPTAIAPDDGPAICHVYDTENVALIAAAPDLLAELKEAVEIIAVLRIALDAMRGLSIGQCKSIFTDQTAAMHAAIDKAEGKA